MWFWLSGKEKKHFNIPISTFLKSESKKTNQAGIYFSGLINRRFLWIISVNEKHLPVLR